MNNDLFNAIFGELIFTENSKHIDTIIEKIKPLLSRISFSSDITACKEKNSTLLTSDLIINFIKDVEKSLLLIKDGLEKRQLFKVIAGGTYLNIKFKIFIVNSNLEDLYLDIYCVTSDYIKGVIDSKYWLTRLQQILERKSHSK